MALTREQMEEFMATWKKAYETKDTDLLLTAFAPHGTYQDTPFNKPMADDEFRNYWEIAKLQKDIQASYEVLAVTDNTGIARWSTSFAILPKEEWANLTSALLPKSFTSIELDPAGENRFAQDGIYVIKFNDQGLATELMEWWHTQKV